jgi:TonB family protein
MSWNRLFRAVTLLGAVVAGTRTAAAHDTTAPVLEFKVDPVYPHQALDAGIEGTVVMELYIDAKGDVEHVRVLSSAGHGLEEAAVAAAKQFHFKPATVDKAPVASQIVYEQQFKIDRIRGEVTQPDLTTIPKQSEQATEMYVITERAPMTSASATTVRQQDFELRPRSSPNDILRVVPGLVTAQHQGGGKADQLFLRGFDADHGTDVAVFVDGIPVNMPSHAHGQGYADLHFLIPEVLETVDVYKGAYYPQFGDFDTAGAVNLVTRRDFPKSQVALTGGSFDTFRFLGVGSGNTSTSSSWVAVEAAQTDGPFDHAEDLRRYNVWAKSTIDLSPDSSLGIMATAYGSEWMGSGQIPSRLLGTPELPDRFAALDPSEGGSTERQSVSALYHLRPDPLSRIDARLYFINYRLALFNDFTFFLRDPVNADEIEQDDARSVLGGTFEYEWNRQWRGAYWKTLIGAQFRRDDAHVDLWDVTSQNGNFRKRIGRHVENGDLAFGTNDDVRIENLAFYLDEDVVWTKWLRTVAMLRGDYFAFDVNDLGEALGPGMPKTSGLAQKALLSPKASIVLTPHRLVDVYLNYGTGFHSNDARLAVRGEVGNVVPRAYEWEVGARARLFDRVDAAFAFWYTYLESEIVFRGDSGTFSPSDPSERYGADFELRGRLSPWLFADADLTLAHAEFVSSGGNGGAVALAPRIMYTGGLTARWHGFKGAIRVRGVGDRPVIDPGDEALFRLQGRPIPQALGYAVVDAFVGYERPRWEALVTVENLLDTDWREAQFANRSCSRAENAAPSSPCYLDPGTGMRPNGDKILPDVHFTPGNPINAMATVRLYF